MYILARLCVSIHIVYLDFSHHRHPHRVLYETLPFIHGMGWLRSVGSMQLQVSFAEYCLFYRALLQKRLIILSILLTRATPYHNGNKGYRIYWDTLLQVCIDFRHHPGQIRLSREDVQCGYIGCQNIYIEISEYIHVYIGC